MVESTRQPVTLAAARPRVYPADSTRLEAHIDLQRRALRASSERQLVDEVVRCLSIELGKELCAALKLDGTGGHLDLVASEGCEKGLVGRMSVPACLGSQAGYTLISRGPVFCEDLTREARFEPCEPLTRYDIRSGITVTIHSPSGHYGALGAFSREGGALTTSAPVVAINSGRVPSRPAFLSFSARPHTSRDEGGEVILLFRSRDGLSGIKQAVLFVLASQRRASLFYLELESGLSHEELQACVTEFIRQGLAQTDPRPDGMERRRMVEITPAGIAAAKRLKSLEGSEGSEIAMT